MKSEKIESVQSLRLGDAHFVRVRTESGLEGVGQSACWAYPDAVDAVVRSFEPHLLGQEALRIEHLWQYLYRAGPFRGSVLSAAVSAVDIALWDIKGKCFDTPIWELLGGRCRDRIRLMLLLLDDFLPEDIAAAVGDGVGQGFTAVKFDPIPSGHGDMTLEALVRAVEARVEAARDAAASDADLILEFHRKLTPLQALPVLQSIAKFNILASEDPIQIDSITSQADIAQRLAQPLANGERLNTIWEYKELLAQGGPQFIRPDLGLAGGITHVKKIAAIAEAHHAAVMSHNFLGPLLTAASVHIDAAIPNFLVQEYLLSDEQPGKHGLQSCLSRDGGFLTLPHEPGLGVILNEDAARPEDLNKTDIPPAPLLRRDGSINSSV
ncbi:MAG: mandelate racemase/muconate lactonizing enzyme family protein [Pseudomonadota bacterium]